MNALGTTMRLLFGSCAAVAITRSISAASWTGVTISFTANEAAAASIHRKNSGKYGAVAGLYIMTIRTSDGEISLSTSTHLPPIENSKDVNPVTLPPGCAMLATKPCPIGSATFTNTNGSGLPPHRLQSRRCSGHYQVWVEGHQLRRVGAHRLEVAAGPAIIEAGGAAIDPTVFLETLQEGSDPGLCFRIVLSICHQHADAPHLLRLRARRERPPRRCAAEQRYERAPSHSNISSARPDRGSGMVMPSARAVFKLM